MTVSTTQIDLLFRYRVKEGGESRFQEYLEKVLPLTEAEPYVLEYETFVQEDGTYLQHERYEDEEAINKHLVVTAEGQYLELGANSAAPGVDPSRTARHPRGEPNWNRSKL